MLMKLPGEPGGCRSPHCYQYYLRCLYSTLTLGKWQVLCFFLLPPFQVTSRVTEPLGIMDPSGRV